MSSPGKRAAVCLALSASVACGSSEPVPAPPVSQAAAPPAASDPIDLGALGDVTFPWPADDLHARAIDLGCAHACILEEGGHVSCWGRNQFGELGDGTAESRATRAWVVDLPPAVEIAATCASTCARTEGGDVWCWGGGDLGEIGDGDRAGHRLRPVRLTDVGGVRALASSDAGTCAVLDSEGRASCWGTFDAHPGAPFTTPDDGRPRELTTHLAAPPRLAAASPSRACVITRDGVVSCWGSRESVGLDVAPIDPMTPMDGVREAHDLDGAAFLTCASDARGVACWGSGVTAFALGSAPLPPTRIAGMAPDADVSVGDDFVCGTVDGETRCAGYGELVDATGRVHALGAVATRVGALDGLHDLAAGSTAVCGIDAHGGVRCVAWLSGHEGEPPAPPS